MGKKKTYGVRLTIPDGTPEKQLEQVESFIEIMRTFAKVAGEEKETEQAIKPLKEAAMKLKLQLNPATSEEKDIKV